MLKFAPAILLFAVFVVPRVAPAGDEVDYSAPYLVVENGELVTKYPARNHEGALLEANVQAGESPAPPHQKTAVNNAWVIAAVAIAVVIALLIMIKRRRQRREETE